jgi:hypothetical protein
MTSQVPRTRKWVGSLMRLGEILIQKNVIDDRQLSEALDAQLIYGGHLGTCLIELGYIDEETLGQVLSETFNMPYATVECFDDIPRFVIDCVPLNLVEKHQVVPFRLVDRQLDVAMIDPTDLRSLDDLSFASGHRIGPWVAPEVRIFQAMERYYDVERRVRYIQLSQRLDKNRSVIVSASDNQARAPKATAKPTAPARVPTRATSPASATVAAVANTTTPTTSAASATAIAEPPARKPQRQPQPTAAQQADALAEVTDLLCRVKGRAKLAEVVLDHASKSLQRSVLFRVKAGSALVWDTRGIDLPEEEEPSEKAFPITTEPLFSLLLGKDHYRGPCPDDERYDGLFRTLGMDRPDEVLMVPVYQDDRLIALLYGDGGPEGSIEGETADHVRLAHKLGFAVSLIDLKHKLRSC